MNRSFRKFLAPDRNVAPETCFYRTVLESNCRSLLLSRLVNHSLASTASLKKQDFWRDRTREVWLKPAQHRRWKEETISRVIAVRCREMNSLGVDIHRSSRPAPYSHIWMWSVLCYEGSLQHLATFNTVCNFHIGPQELNILSSIQDRQEEAVGKTILIPSS